MTWRTLECGGYCPLIFVRVVSYNSTRLWTVEVWKTTESIHVYEVSYNDSRSLKDNGENYAESGQNNNKNWEHQQKKEKVVLIHLYNTFDQIFKIKVLFSRSYCIQVPKKEIDLLCSNKVHKMINSKIPGIILSTTWAYWRQFLKMYQGLTML